MCDHKKLIEQYFIINNGHSAVEGALPVLNGVLQDAPRHVLEGV